MIRCCLFWCQSFDDVSLYVCSYHFSAVSVAECTETSPILHNAIPPLIC